MIKNEKFQNLLNVHIDFNAIVKMLISHLKK